MTRFYPNNRSPYHDGADERDVLDFDEEPRPRTEDQREGRSEASGGERRQPEGDPQNDPQRDRDDFPRSRR